MKAQIVIKKAVPQHLGRLIRVPSSLSKSQNKSAVNWPLGWKGVVVHGGGGVVFRESHPLVQHLSDNYCSEGVYSLELPSHGICASNNIISSEHARNCVYNMISPLIDSQTIVVGYSVGGMFLTSLWKSFCQVSRFNPMGVFIGCHPRLVARWYRIRAFWTVPFTYLSLRHRSLQEMHCGDRGEAYKDYWKTTVSNVRYWLNPNSDIHVPRRDLGFLLHREMMTHWIIGSSDTAYPFEHFRKSIEQETITGGLERVMRIESTHFNYFSESWPYTQLAIDRVLRGFATSEAER